MELLFILVAVAIAIIGLVGCVVKALLLKFEALWKEGD